MIKSLIKAKNKSNLGFTRIILGGACLFIFFSLLQNSFSYLDPDLGWHLKFGKEIWQEKGLFYLENDTQLMLGKEWIDHEWLANVLIYGIYANLGYIFLNLFFIFIIILTLFLLNKIFRDYYSLKNNNYGNFALAVIFIGGVNASLGHLGIRVQELALLNLVILMLILKNWEKNRRLFPLFLLLPLFYLWACLHGSFMIGIIFLCLWLGAKILEIFIFKNKNLRERLAGMINLDQRLSFKEIKTVLFFIFLSAVITLVTPYFLKLPAFLLSYHNDYYLTHIEEWVTPFRDPVNFSQIGYLSFFIFCLIVFLLNFKKRKNVFHQKTNFFLSDLLITSFFFLLAVLSRRNFPLFFVVSFPLYAYFLINFFKFKDSLLDKDCFPFRSLIRGILIFMFLLAIFLKAIQVRFNNNPFLNYCEAYPCQALTYLKDSPYKNLKIFNVYQWGGYLLWNWPGKKIFLDGRMPQSDLGNQTTVLEEYGNFFQKNKTKELLEKHQIEVILIENKENNSKNSSLNSFPLKILKGKEKEGANNLTDHLKNSSDYVLVYQDKTALVFIKKDQLFK